MRVALVVNDTPVELDVEARTTLLDTLRDHLNLTGSHAGCEHGACGACTVLVAGRAVRSCLILIGQMAGQAVTTIEAIGTPESLHPVQEALRAHHGLQCGFCTPGMVLTAIDLLAHSRQPDEAAVRDALAGNLCRCTGYTGAILAVRSIADGTSAERTTDSRPPVAPRSDGP